MLSCVGISFIVPGLGRSAMCSECVQQQVTIEVVVAKHDPFCYTNIRTHEDECCWCCGDQLLSIICIPIYQFSEMVLPFHYTTTYMQQLGCMYKPVL